MDNTKTLMLLEEAAETPAAIRLSADGKFIYAGYPFAGTTGVNSATWKIRRFEFAANGDIYTTYAGGRKDKYGFIFAQCENYNYAFA